MDEIIFLNLNRYILDKIYLLVIEITNYNFILKNKNLFFNKLNLFKDIYNENGKKISISDVKILINKKKEFNLLAKK